MKSPCLAACIGLAVAAAVGNNSAQALTLSNGSFEQPTATANSSSTFNNGTQDLEWVGSNGTVELFRETFQTYNAFDGDQWAEVQAFNTVPAANLGTLTQTVTVSSSVPIGFSFAHRARQGTGSNTLNFKIVNTADSTDILFNQNYTAAQDADWFLNQGISSRAAAGSSYYLIFTALSTGICPIPTDAGCVQPSNGNFIDAVNAVEVVPGPLPLMGAATAFAYTRKIRRRIAKAKA